MVKKEDQRLWLKLNKVYLQILHIKWSYAGTKEKEVIEDMAKYLKKLMDDLEQDE